MCSTDHRILARTKRSAQPCQNSSTGVRSIRVYLAKHSGRVLTLQPAPALPTSTRTLFGGEEGGEEEAAARNSKKHILAFILPDGRAPHVQHQEKLTYEEIKEKTLIPDRELTRALLPLSVGKPSQRILVKSPIQGNRTFTSQSTKPFRLQVSQQAVLGPGGGTRRGGRWTRTGSMRLRPIVRIMKSRKHYSQHNQLYQSCGAVGNKRFQPYHWSRRGSRPHRAGVHEEIQITTEKLIST